MGNEITRLAATGVALAALNGATAERNAVVEFLTAEGKRLMDAADAPCPGCGADHGCQSGLLVQARAILAAAKAISQGCHRVSPTVR